MNTLTAAELKRRGMAAIEDRLRRGPVHLMKRNRPSAVVVSAEDYQRFSESRPASGGMTALQWLLSVRTSGKRSRASIDARLKADRNW